MEDVNTAVSQFCALSREETSENTQKYASLLANYVEDDKVTLLQLVQQLGPRITLTNDEERSRAIHCLASVLKSISPTKLSRQDIGVLVEFLSAKLSDKACLQYVAQGLQSLVLLRQFNPKVNGTLASVLNRILADYDLSSYLAKVRYEMLVLMQSILEKCRDDIIFNPELNDSYVQVFLHVSSGEKDPRNLLVCFEASKKVNWYFRFDIKNDLHKHFVEELFDNCFCYFPISFKPPPNDPYKITLDQLKLALRETLTSQDLFAKDLLNNLFDKLTSTNPVVRNDVLLTLLLAVNLFHEDTLLEYWETLWNGLKFEILHLETTAMFDPTGARLYPENTETLPDSDEKKSLYLVLDIVSRLTAKLDSDDFLQAVTQDLKEYLDIGSKYLKHCVILLSTIASASPSSFNYIHRYIFKHEHLGKFISVEQEDDSAMETDVSITVARQRDLIDTLGYVLISYQMIQLKVNDTSFFDTNYLFLIKDNLMVFLGLLLLSSSNIEKSLKCKVIVQYVKLIQLKSLLSYDEKHAIVSVLNEMFFDVIEVEKPNDKLVEELIKGLISLSEDGNDHNSRLIVDVFLPNLLVRIDASNALLTKYLEVLGMVVVSYQLLEVLAIRLINRLSDDKNFNRLIIELIVSLVLKVQGRNQFLMNSWLKGITPSLLKRASELDVSVAVDLQTLEGISQLVGLIVKYSDVSKHQQLLDEFAQAFYHNVDSVNLGLKGIDLRKQQSSQIFLFNAVLSKIDKSSKLDISSNDLKEIAVTTEGIHHPLLKVHYLQNLCLLVNKFFLKDEELEPLVQSLDQVNQPSKFEVLIWIIKALVLRMSKLGMSYLNKFLERLETGTNSTLILKSFDIILRDLPIFAANKELSKGSKIISKVNHLNTRALYKQQVFNLVLDRVLKYPEDVVFLQLLSVLTKNIGSDVLKFRINDIIPLTLKSIQFNNLLDTSLETLAVILESNDLLDHLPVLIKRLVELCTTQIVESGVVVNTERIRYMALKCILLLLQKNSKEILLLYKGQLLAALVKPLDDPKRSIRKITCDIRQLLYETRE